MAHTRRRANTCVSASAALAALCLSSSGLTAVLPTHAFELQWMHSIEKTQWLEHWQVSTSELRLARASVATSGAGMDIPDHAVLVNGVYEYTVNLTMASVTLSHSPYTAQASLCINNRCQPLASWLPGLPEVAAVELRACDTAQ